MGILPIAIQLLLIYLLFNKRIVSQKAIKFWVLLFFFIAQGLKIIGIAIQSWTKYMKSEENALEMLLSNNMIYSLVFVTVGIIIWILNKDFGE